MKFRLTIATLAAGVILLSGAALAQQPAGEGAVDAVKVLRPLGGEKFTEGGAVEVQWQFNGITPDRIGVFLLDGKGKSVKKIGELSGREQQKSMIWRKSGPPAKKYVIKVVANVGKLDYEGVSKAFEILPDTTKPGRTKLKAEVTEETPAPLVVNEPNGGETLLIGGMVRVRWTCSAKAEGFTVELSRNGGKSWGVLQSDLPGDVSKYDWPISGPTSADCLMRVTAGKDGPGAQSAHTFRIIQDSKAASTPTPTGR